MRYQLLKTSPYLGGQIRWDIPLHYHYGDDKKAVKNPPKGVHYIDTPELHIVPLDDSIPYVDTKKNADETFNYTHLENIKQLATQIGGAMYSCEGEWTGNYWLYNNGDLIDPYSHIFNMGARRIPFKRYGKQFSYLCPLWISEETDARKLEFEISVRVTGEERDHIARRVFKLGDKICDYMNEYLWKSARYIEPDPSSNIAPEYQGVSDDLLSIKFNPDYAAITGVHTLTGRYATYDITYLIGSILDREVPMMEFDNMLVSKFRENNMIAQQLINLNFVFNMDDISFALNDMLLGHSITISLRAKYDGEYLDIKDFYTNYTKIPGFDADTFEMSDDINVCEYIGDNHIIDYLYTNKFTQPIFHWTMVENPKYIYNFYDGFAPSFFENGEYHRVIGHYYDQADISQLYHDIYNSAATWCKIVDYTGFSAGSVSSYKRLVEESVLVNKNTEKYSSKLIINSNTGIAYLNNNRFDLIKSGDLLNDFIELISKDYEIYAYSIITNAFDPQDQYDDRTDHFDFYNVGKKIFIYSHGPNSKYLTFRRLIKFLQQANISQSTDTLWDADNNRRVKFEFNVDSDDPNFHVFDILVKLLIDMYNHWTPPYKVEFSRSTITDNYPTFDGYNPQETIMYKYNVHDGFVLRYTGVLCPLFIDGDDPIYKNKVFRYKQWSDINTPDVQQYNKMLKTGLEPLFPSLDFYSLVEEDDGLLRSAWYNDNNWPWEIVWKNNGMIYIMPESFSVQTIPQPPFEYNKENEEILWAYLYEYITELGIPVNDSVWLKHKMKELYEISYNFDYVSETDISSVIYYVNFNLR